MKRSLIPILFLTAAAFAAGYGTSQWLTARGEAASGAASHAAGSKDPKAAPVVVESAPGAPPVSAFELRIAIAEQQAQVEENRRRLEEMNPDVAAMEERHQRVTATMGRLSRTDLPEAELMELTASLGGADWMPKTIAEYRTAQEEYGAMTDRYGKKHPKMVSAEDRLTTLGNKMTAEAGRVFRETENLSRTLEQALPEARARAAEAQKHPELLQPLEQALEESEKRLEELRGKLAEKTGRRLSAPP